MPAVANPRPPPTRTTQVPIKQQALLRLVGQIEEDMVDGAPPAFSPSPRAVR